MVFNPIWYGGGQKHLRYIIQIYISQFKSDYSGVKSKSEVHIIRSHLENKSESHYRSERKQFFASSNKF